MPRIGIIFFEIYLILLERGLFTAGKMVPEEISNERYAKGELTREQYT
ncbi:MAG: hypothetical protein MUO26_15640 [Methanotrichaceae archaeon]|nr:hypothetical protein [Methanotrichaceae archaeon]